MIKCIETTTTSRIIYFILYIYWHYSATMEPTLNPTLSLTYNPTNIATMEPIERIRIITNITTNNNNDNNK